MIKTITSILLLLSVTFCFADSIIPEDTLLKWGYSNKKTSHYNYIFCSGDNDAKKKMIQSIKAIRPMKNKGNTFYRFTLIKENYSSIETANNRLDELKNPPHKTSKHSKLCNLVKAFRVKNTVFFIHTDAGLFITELNRMTSLYQISVDK